VRLRDIDVFYRVAGTGRRLVLLHGLAQDHGMWRHQQEHLDDFTTIALDLRGHGQTSLGDADGTLAQLGADLVAFLEYVGPSTCVGSSLGGTVVLWAAAARPDLFEGVGVMVTSSVVGTAAEAGLRERIEIFERGDADEIRAVLRADTDAQLALDTVDVDALTDERLAAIGNRGGYVNGARAMARLHDEPLTDALAKIGHRVLIIAGEKDVVCPPRAAQIMVEHLRDAAYVEMPGVGHLVTDEDPGVLTATLRKWLTGGDM
jgi:pimeloyl-ACP methyl ester carboxylesterase